MCALLQTEGEDQRKDPAIQQMVGSTSRWEMSYSMQGDCGKWWAGSASRAYSHTAQEKSRQCLDEGPRNILGGGVNRGKGRERDHTHGLEESPDRMDGPVSAQEGMSFSKAH